MRSKKVLEEVLGICDGDIGRVWKVKGAGSEFWRRFR